MDKQQLAGDTIFVIRDFLTPEECADFVRLGEQAGYGDAPISTASGFVMRKDVRDNARVMIDDPELAARLWGRLRPLVPAEWFGWESAGVNERFRFYRYDVGQRFDVHTDGYFQRDNGERSHFTFMVYLNDDFEGGTTNFYRGERPLRVEPVAGMALLFAHQQLHEGAAVQEGRKYVLRSDVMYRRAAARASGTAPTPEGA